MKLQPRIDEICHSHSVDRSSMELNAVHSLAAPDKMNIMFENRIATTLTYVITTGISAALCGGGSVALIAEGPLGLIAGAVIGIIIAFVGKKAVDCAIRTRDLPPLIRKISAASFRTGLYSARQRKAIEDELIKTMQKPEFEEQLVKDITASLEGQITSMARSVEMPIIQ